MHKTFSILRHFLAWLGETDRPADGLPANVDWADLPPYHPCAD